MNKWKYYPMAMHLHCGHQPKASMESHIFNAASLGMEYIRFTPHDTRTGPDQYAVRSFNFARGEAVYVDESGYVRGWELAGEAEVLFDRAGMQMNIQAPCAGGLCEGSAKFYSEGKRQAVSLLADVMVTLDLAVETHGDGQVILDLEMSQRPPDHQPAHIYYCVGSGQQSGEDSTCWLPEELPPHTALLPLTADEDGLYRLRISEDAEKLGEIVGGLDNAFIFLYVRVMAGKGGSACCRIRHLEIDVQRGFEEVIARQRLLWRQPVCMGPHSWKLDFLRGADNFHCQIICGSGICCLWQVCL